MLGTACEKKRYGFAFSVDSPYRDRINAALLTLIENVDYQPIRKNGSAIEPPQAM